MSDSAVPPSIRIYSYFIWNQARKYGIRKTGYSIRISAKLDTCLSSTHTLVKYTRKRITHVYAYISRWSGNQTSLVTWIKTEFRSSLSTETVSSLIGYHFNRRCKCWEISLLILMSLFLLKESHVLMKEISILKTIVFFAKIILIGCDDLTKCG